MGKNKYNRYTLAIACFKKANKIRPEKRTYEKLFQCYVRRNKYDFISQIDLYLYNEGMYELDRGDLESAIEYFMESNFSAPMQKHMNGCISVISGRMNLKKPSGAYKKHM